MHLQSCIWNRIHTYNFNESCRTPKACTLIFYFELTGFSRNNLPTQFGTQTYFNREINNWKKPKWSNSCIGLATFRKRFIGARPIWADKVQRWGWDFTQRKGEAVRKGRCPVEGSQGSPRFRYSQSFISQVK